MQLGMHVTVGLLHEMFSAGKITQPHFYPRTFYDNKTYAAYFTQNLSRKSGQGSFLPSINIKMHKIESCSVTHTICYMLMLCFMLTVPSSVTLNILVRVI